MLDLASDLLFFLGGGRILARPGLRLGLPGCALCWIHRVATMYVGDQRGVTGARLDLRSGTSFLRA